MNGTYCQLLYSRSASRIGWIGLIYRLLPLHLFTVKGGFAGRLLVLILFLFVTSVHAASTRFRTPGVCGPALYYLIVVARCG